MRHSLCTIVLLVVFLSGMLSCKKSKSLDNDEPIQKAEPIALIPNVNLGEWDEGYVLDGKYSYYLKTIEDGHTLAYFSNADDGEKYLFAVETDENAKIRVLSTSKDSYLFSYSADSLYVTHCFLSSGEATTEVFKLDDDLKTETGPSDTKGIKISPKTAMKIISALPSVASCTDDAVIHATGDAVKGLVQDIVVDVAFDAAIAVICPPAAIPIIVIKTLIELGFAVKDTYEIIKDKPYLGFANTSCTLSENHVNVTLLGGNTIPFAEVAPTVCVGVSVKYCRQNNPLWAKITTGEADYIKETVISSANDVSISFDLPQMKYGYYIATPFLAVSGANTRYGESSVYFCKTIDEEPNYNISNKRIESIGSGKLSVQFSINYIPLKTYENLRQYLKCNSKSGQFLFTIGTYPYKQSYSFSKEPTIYDFDINYSSYEANYVIKPLFGHYSDPEVNRSKTEAPYTDIVVSYNERPSLRFENVRIDRTEKRTEKKTSSSHKIMTKGSSPDEPDEEEEITYYTTYFTATYAIKGAFWMSDVSNKSSGTAKASGLTTIKPQKNGTYSFKGTLSYDSDTKANNAVIANTISLLGGGSINSSNSLVFTGGEEITAAYCN